MKTEKAIQDYTDREIIQMRNLYISKSKFLPPFTENELKIEMNIRIDKIFQETVKDYGSTLDNLGNG